MVLKKLILDRNYVKGTQLNPELRKKSKKQDPATRKKQEPALRKKQTLLRASFALLRTSQDGRRRVISGSQTQHFCRNANSATPSSVARATPHPSEL
jgi:hypothetical protein